MCDTQYESSSQDTSGTSVKHVKEQYIHTITRLSLALALALAPLVLTSFKKRLAVTFRRE